MSTILLVGPDPETREILKLRLELEGSRVLTALGKNDAIPLIKGGKLDAVIVDLIDYEDKEVAESASIINNAKKSKQQSILFLPRGPQSSTKLLQADMTIRKPFDLNKLVAQVSNLINTPKKSSTSHKDSRQRS